jgi:hypothetical protein
VLQLQAGVVNTMRLPAGVQVVYLKGHFGLPRLHHPLFGESSMHSRSTPSPGIGDRVATIGPWPLSAARGWGELVGAKLHQWQEAWRV